MLLQGVGASPGRIRGKVRVIRGEQDISSFRVETVERDVESGEVLVAPFVTPFDIIAISKAGAIVVNRGGITSHAAVIARELGIPCIVRAERATELLTEGMEVIVDANEGKVYQ